MVKSLGSFIDEGFENVEKGVTQAVKQQVKATVQSVKSQAGAGTSQPMATDDHGSNEAVAHAQANPTATQDVVNSFYAPTVPGEKHGMSSKDKKPSEFFEQQIEDGKTPEEAAKLESLRSKLHQETYYIPLTQRKSTEDEHKEEEKEKEQEKMEELQLEEEKKKQDDDIALRQATHKTEQNPGASG